MWLLAHHFFLEESGAAAELLFAQELVQALTNEHLVSKTIACLLRVPLDELKALKVARHIVITAHLPGELDILDAADLFLRTE